MVSCLTVKNPQVRFFFQNYLGLFKNFIRIVKLFFSSILFATKILNLSNTLDLFLNTLLEPILFVVIKKLKNSEFFISFSCLGFLSDFRCSPFFSVWHKKIIREINNEIKKYLYWETINYFDWNKNKRIEFLPQTQIF